MAIGERLKGLRIESGQSLQQVADAIDASKAHIWELESNKSRNPSLDLLKKLAEHFNTTIAFLISEDDPSDTAHAFFQRNGNKLGKLDTDELEIVQRLLDKFSDRRGDIT